jgi:hypothetical protein
MNSNIKNVLVYIEKQLIQVSSFDESAGKKGSQIQMAKAKKEGYLEALQNVKKVIKDNVALK